MFCVVCLMRRRPPRSTRTDTLFPYTTLFRSRIEANINAKALDVVAGVGDWNSDTPTVTARKPKDSAPDYAIDSSALGGMYANRLRLIATEAGAAVRALGDVAATAADFTINAAGKIEFAAQASAQHDIRITSSGNQGITLHRAALTATRDIRLSTGGALTDRKSPRLTSSH